MQLASYRVALITISSLVLIQLASAHLDPESCNLSCRFVVTPTIGPAGKEGAVGRTGATGQRGPKGDTGATGQPGPEDPKGDAGFIGHTGPQGPKGDAGATGQTGLRGLKGDTGSAGQTGPQGLKGDTGTFNSSGTYTGLKLDAPRLSGDIQVASGGGIFFANPSSSVLDYYEYHSVAASVTGYTAPKPPIQLVRVGRHVTAVVHEFITSVLPTGGQFVFAAETIPERFRPISTDVHLVIQGIKGGKNLLCAASVKTDGSIRISGGEQGATFSGKNNQGFYTASLQWLAA